MTRCSRRVSQIFDDNREKSVIPHPCSGQKSKSQLQIHHLENSFSRGNGSLVHPQRANGGKKKRIFLSSSIRKPSPTYLIHSFSPASRLLFADILFNRASSFGKDEREREGEREELIFRDKSSVARRLFTIGNRRLRSTL